MDVTTEDAVVFTLDARDSVMLEVMTETLGLTEVQVRQAILGALRETTEVLDAKGIRYRNLRNALVPQRERREVALMFLADEGGYGIGPGSAAHSVLGLLPSKLNCSVLRGDLLGGDHSGALAVLHKHLVSHKEFAVRHPSQVYVVYLNNLTDTMMVAITDHLVESDPYIGHVDCTFGSPMKDWLANSLSSAYLKVGSVFVNGHEDDVSNVENRNLPGWPVEEFGFSIRSLQSMYFSLFLSYKIERSTLPGETDTRFALNAISNAPRPLAILDVLVDPEKLGYLQREKLGILTSAGLQEATRESLQDEIRSRVDRSYIYELEYKSQWGTSQFNLMLELARADRSAPRRVKAVLAYEPGAARLRLISLY